MKTEDIKSLQKQPIFSEVFDAIDRIFKRSGYKGIALSGETEKDWIFKPQIRSGQDDWTSLIVSKKDGSIRYPNMIDPEDIDVIYNAKIIEN